MLELPKFHTWKSKKISKQEAWMTYLCGNSEEKMQIVLEEFDKIKKLDNLLEDYWKNEVME